LITIGTDPEFRFYDPAEKEFVPAEDVCGYRTRSLIGTDGCSSVGEIRPRPEKSPIKLTERVKKLLQMLWQQYGSYYVFAGSNQGGYALGGHIHFSLRPEEELLLRMDRYVGVTTYLLEDFPTMRGDGYGQIHAYRSQPWGVEYRTPSSFILDKGLTQGVLCLAYAVAFESTHLKRKNLWHGHPPRPTIGELRDFREVDMRGYLRKFWPQIWSEIKHLKLYPKFEPQIAYLNHMIRNKLYWQQNREILGRWRIRVSQPRLPQKYLVEVYEGEPAMKAFSGLAFDARVYLYPLYTISGDQFWSSLPLCQRQLRDIGRSYSSSVKFIGDKIGRKAARRKAEEGYIAIGLSRGVWKWWSPSEVQRAVDVLLGVQIGTLPGERRDGTLTGEEPASPATPSDGDIVVIEPEPVPEDAYEHVQLSDGYLVLDTTSSTGYSWVSSR